MIRPTRGMRPDVLLTVALKPFRGLLSTAALAIRFRLTRLMASLRLFSMMDGRDSGRRRPGHWLYRRTLFRQNLRHHIAGVSPMDT